jgi:two-component system chemotaxis response regulator CheY
LETAGFEVDQAINGLEAFEKLLVQAFDLAIVDVNMPRMDGVSFLRALRKMTSETAELPALIVTTESSAEDAEDARAAGANFYLVKPVAEADLVHHAKALAGVPK